MANAEVFRSVVIPPGKSYLIDSTLDYSSSATVAVTVQCPGCTTATTSLGAAGLVLQARWSVPEADTYVAAEVESATAFPYWDEGGVIFNVYGSQFRLTLLNKGSQAISIQQITLFHRIG